MRLKSPVLIVPIFDVRELFIPVVLELVDDIFLRLGLPFIFYTHFAGFVALPFRGCGGCFLRSRIFDSCSSSWNRGFHEFPTILHIRLIRVG